VTDIDISSKTVKIRGNSVRVEVLFNNYKELLCIFQDLKKKGVKLCVASLNFLSTVQKMTNLAFPNIFEYFLTPDNIDEESNSYVFKLYRFIIDTQCPKYYGKNIMIKTIMKKYNLTDPSKIIFFDDDYSNTTCARDCLGIKVVNNNKSGVTANLLNSLLYEKNEFLDGFNKPKSFVIYKLKR
jgi:hypothetical protein